MPGDWNRSQFSTLYGRFVDKVSELKAIDAVLDYLDGRGHVNVPSQLRWVTIGDTYPFEKTAVVPNISIDVFDQAVRDAYATGSGWAADRVSGVDSRIAFVVDSMPSVMQSPVEQLRAVVDPLEVIGNSQDLGDLNAHLADWDGGAKESFEVYRTSIVRAAANQALFIDRSAAYLDAVAGAARAGQVDLFSYVTALEAAADDQLRQRQDDNRGATTSEVLALLSSASGAASVIPGPTGIVAAVASGALGYASVLTSEPTPVPISAASAEELVDLFVTGMEGTADNVDALLAQVDTQTGAMRDLFDLTWPGEIMPNEPAVDESTGPADLHRP